MLASFQTGGIPNLTNDTSPVVLIGLFFLPFINEDSAVLSSALLACQRVFPYWETFFACFLGMWVSDFAVYAVARLGGRPLLESKWGQRLVACDQRERAAGWFDARGGWTLVLSRFVLGIRTALLVISGLLVYPSARFLVVTFFGALGWLFLIFGLFAFLGPAAAALFGLRWLIALVTAAGGGSAFLAARTRRRRTVLKAGEAPAEG